MLARTIFILLFLSVASVSPAYGHHDDTPTTGKQVSVNSVCFTLKAYKDMLEALMTDGVDAGNDMFAQLVTDGKCRVEEDIDLHVIIAGRELTGMFDKDTSIEIWSVKPLTNTDGEFGPTMWTGLIKHMVGTGI